MSIRVYPSPSSVSVLIIPQVLDGIFSKVHHEEIKESRNFRHQFEDIQGNLPALRAHVASCSPCKMSTMLIASELQTAANPEE